MKRSLLWIGFFLLNIPAYSWDLLGNVGGRCTSMGSCSVAFCDFWSIQNNPAGLATWRSLSVGISYENRFLIKELSYANTGLVIPVKIGTLGVSYSRFGFEDYNENNVGLAFARDFGPYLKIGLKLDYLSFRFSGDYATRRTATFELGIQSNITDDLCLGVYIFNPINVKLKTIYNQHVPIVFKFGLSYRITKDFIMATEVEYDSDRKMDYRFGLEYLTTKDFYIRAGVHTNPGTACVGVGYTVSRVIIDVSATMNQFTGTTFLASLIFKIKEPKP